MWRGISVGVATGYIESRWGEIFCTRSNRPRDPPGLLYNGYRVPFSSVMYQTCVAGYLSRRSDWLRLEVPGIESRWGEIFCIRSNQPRGPPGLLYNGYRVTFQRIKRPGRGVNPHHPSSQEGEERVELYFYPSSLCGHSREDFTSYCIHLATWYINFHH